MSDEGLKPEPLCSGLRRMPYSLGETDARPQSSQRRYSTGSESDRPITCALGAPHRGQTMPAEVLLAMGVSCL